MSDERADGRQLFRYVVGEEWPEYRAIMGVFAGTFFAEFTPDDVAAALAADGTPLDVVVVGERLESLRRWGNLTASSAVGNPTSLADYYRRRSRYLITRVGQEVHDLVEGVLNRVDEVRDVTTGRMRALRDALAALAEIDPERAEPERLADLVRAVFDPHRAFTSEITQFFAAINQWQSRYDLTPDEFTFFAEVLVGYVAERLDEIERTARPIGRQLLVLAPVVPVLVERAGRGLASRVEAAGLQDAVTISHIPGTTVTDWEHLSLWFVGRPGQPSRIERLHHEAVAAIRTLTLNLTRLSRVGLGATSRRADLVRLATFFAAVGSAGEAAPLAVAAFGLHPSSHYGALAADADDPVAPSTPWLSAPRAEVPVSIRERGETTNRGKATPMADRSIAQRSLLLQRERELDARRRVDAELLAAAALDGAALSTPALARLQQLVGLTLQQLPVHGPGHVRTDGALRCTLSRAAGSDTVVSSPEGTLRFRDLLVRVEASDGR